MENNNTQQISQFIADYRTRRDARKKYIKENYIETCFNRPKIYGRKRSKRPWYMLTKGNFVRFVEMKKSWGMLYDYVKVDSEYKEFALRSTKKTKMGRAEFMERMTQHKLAKWVRKNPAPCGERDLFAKEYLDPWKKRYNEVEEQLRNKVILTYDKTVVPFNKSAELYSVLDSFYKDYEYEYHNIDPTIVGYPLSRYVNKQSFISKNELIKHMKKYGNDCIKGGIDTKRVIYQCNGINYLSVIIE